MRKLILAALVCAALPALAKPPPGADPNSPKAQWYHSLMQPNTDISCCSEADCRPTDYEIRADGHYWVLLPVGRIEWDKVPNDAVIHKTDNPEGRGVLCWTPALGIMCFVPAAQS